MNEKEKEIAEKNLKEREKELKELEEAHQYSEDLSKLNKATRKFKEKWIKFENRLKEKSEKETMEINQEKIENLKFTIDSTKKQLNQKGG